MTPAGLAFERFPSTITDEWMMRIGAADAPPILIVPPLFEEMNRTRALLAAVMRRLADMGHGCWLPDLSGTGESEVPLEDVAWYDWGHDVSSAAEHVAASAGKPLIASLRGGALIDERAEARGWWRFAPVDGAMLARDLVRSGLAGGVEWAGYAPYDEMKTSLAAAKPAPVAPLRTARLATDSGEADVKLDGPALWRRSEPGISAALAEAMAADIAYWSRACAAS